MSPAPGGVKPWDLGGPEDRSLRSFSVSDLKCLMSRFWFKIQFCLGMFGENFLGMFLPTCQVRVVRFYVSCFLLVLLLLLPLLVLLLLLLLSSLLLSSPRLLSSSPLLLLPAGLQPRPSTPSVPCRTSTTTIHAQCSLPDLNREYPGPVFPAGPEPRPSTPSVPCRTSTARIHAKCSLPDLM